MRELICPYCHSNVSYGATVCTGCGAEIDYSNWLEKPLAFMIGLLCAKFGWDAFNGLLALVFAVVFFFVGCFAGGMFVCFLNLKDEPTFHRSYYHRQ